MKVLLKFLDDVSISASDESCVMVSGILDKDSIFAGCVTAIPVSLLEERTKAFEKKLLEKDSEIRRLTDIISELRTRDIGPKVLKDSSPLKKFGEH